MGAYPSTKKSVLTKLPDYNVELLYYLVIMVALKKKKRSVYSSYDW